MNRGQWGRPLFGIALLAGLSLPATALDPSVRLSAYPHWNAFTPATPTFMGTLTTRDAAIDPTTFVLQLDGTDIYAGAGEWVSQSGGSFEHQFVDDSGKTLTWEYRQPCAGGHLLDEGRHELRFTFRDTEGTLYGNTSSLAFFVDRTPPRVSFQGLTLHMEDDGSGLLLDPRLERGLEAVCAEPKLTALRLEIERVSEDWELSEPSKTPPGLKADLWSIHRTASGMERRFLRTETIGWSVKATRTGDKMIATLELPARDRTNPGAAIEVVAYSRKVTLTNGSGSVPEALAAVFGENSLPFLIDDASGDITAYLAGPHDRAGNAEPPVFSRHLAADSGKPVEAGSSRRGAAAGWSGIAPPAEERSGSVSSTSAAPFGVAQSDILEITNQRVYPNPFNPFHQNATIAFDLSKPAGLEIVVYDWSGEYVDTVFRGPGTVGSNAVAWGGQTEDGRKLGNGTYLIRVIATTDARKESKVLKAVVWNDG